MTPKQQQYQYENGNMDYDPRLDYRRTPQQNNQNKTPYNNNSYNRQTPNNNYNNRNSPYQGRPTPNNSMRTPQPQYNQNKAQIQAQYDNNEYNMRGSRTPFVDYRTGQNVYNKRGFTPGQNQYSDIPNRPPSRPFGDISFKGQQNGGDNYQRYNYSNNQNNYY